MKAIHLKAEIDAEEVVRLPSSESWVPGPAEIIILQRPSAAAALVKYAGTLDDGEAEAMRLAVAEGFESVDPDGW